MSKFSGNLIISIICFFIFSISTQAKSDITSNKLYVGESIQYTAGFPNLVKFINGDSDKPLIIFIPGNSHLARIAYGFPSGNERDFLSYWFHKKGYPFLAISYPIGNSIFEKNYPNYTIQNWSKSIIEIAAQVINEKHLSKNVIILAWSMGGELVQPINVYAKESHIKIQLFIGLSAVTPLYNLFPEGFFNKLKPDSTGLADTQPFHNFFLEMLDNQNKMNQRVIIPPNIYLTQFVGNCPINIMGTAHQYKNDRFIYDLSRAVNDTGSIKINTYPPIAIINGRKDISFTVFSESDWGSLIMRNYYSQFASCAQKEFFKTEASIKLVKKTPSILVKEIEGSHFFFVGEIGAKKTANEVINLIEINNNLLKKFMKLCHK